MTEVKKKLPGWLIPTGVTLAVLLVGWFTVLGLINSNRNEGIRLESTINAQYQSNQNSLSTFITSFYETLGIADRKSEQLDRILTDAVTGRYGDDGLQSPDGALFSAITEAYPDLKGLDTYDQIIDLIKSGRKEYQGKQDKLLDMIKEYDIWRTKGFIRNMFLENYFPSKYLVARVGGQEWTGKEALAKMRQIVVTKQATRAYETNEMEALQAPPLPPRK